MCYVPIISMLQKISFANGTGGTSSSTQAFLTVNLVLTSGVAFLSGPIIGAMSDVLGRFPLLAFTRVMRVFFGVSLVIAWYMWSSEGIIAFIFVGYALEGFADPNMCISIFWAMITDVFDEKSRTAMFGVISAVFAVPVIVGPLIAVPIEDRYGTGMVFMIALFLLSANCVYVSLVFPETLQEHVCKEERKKILLKAANPFRSLAGLCVKTQSSDMPILAMAAIYTLFSMSTAILQSTIIVYVGDSSTLNWDKSFQQYTMAGFASLLVISQSVGVKLCLMLLKEGLSVLLGLVLLCAGLITCAISQKNVVIFLIGVVLSGLSYITIPALNGLVSKQVSCKEQGKLLSTFAAVRSLGIAMGQIVGGATLAYFTNEEAVFIFAGAAFALAAVFAAIGILIFVGVSCQLRLKQRKKRADGNFGDDYETGNSIWSASETMSASVPTFSKGGLMSSLFYRRSGSARSYDIAGSSDVSKSTPSYNRDVAFSAPIMSRDLVQKGFGHMLFSFPQATQDLIQEPRQEMNAAPTAPLLFEQHVLPRTPMAQEDMTAVPLKDMRNGAVTGSPVPTPTGPLTVGRGPAPPLPNIPARMRAVTN